MWVQPMRTGFSFPKFVSVDVKDRTFCLKNTLNTHKTSVM